MDKLKQLLISEATEYEFKSELEVKKPKSWLKTVSAFANGLGDAKTVTEQISKLIQARISPLPDFSLTPHRIDGDKTVLVLEVQSGEIPPYYYVGDGNTTAYVRIGDESVPATPQQLSELVGEVRTSHLTRCPQSTN